MIDYEGLQNHREQTLNDILELLKTENRIACIRPTGYGKSRFLIYPLCQKLSGKKIIFEPTLRIIEYLSDLNFNNYDSKIITYQSLVHKKDKDLLENFKDVSYIFLDECHRTLGKVWNEKLNLIFNTFPNIKIIGLTGTHIRADNRNVVSELFNNVQVKPLYLEESISNNFLPLPDYHCGIYEITTEDKEKIKKTDSPLSKEILTYDIDRDVSEIFHNTLDFNKNHKIICFVSRINYIDSAIMNLRRWLGEKINIFQVHTNQSIKSNNKVIKDFETKPGVNIIFGINMLNEGVHIMGVDSVIFLRKTESIVVYDQQFGRVLNDNKDQKPIVFDLVNNINNLSTGITKIFGIKPDELKGKVEIKTKNGEKLRIFTHQIDIIEKLRSINSIRPWTNEEINYILNNYENESIPELAVSLNRKYESVRQKIIELGLREFVKKAADQYTNEENKIILENKDKYTDEISELLPGRTPKSIMRHMRETLKIEPKIRRSDRLYWTDGMDQIIRSNTDKTTSEIAEIVSKEINRKVETIQVSERCNLLNIKVKSSTVEWTEELDQTLKTLAIDHTKQEIVEIMGISFLSVKTRCKKLGILTKESRKRIEEEKIKYIKEKLNELEHETHLSNFLISIGLSYTVYNKNLVLENDEHHKIIRNNEGEIK